jgi:phenylalanyl-tRNA synthetase beta chain
MPTVVLDRAELFARLGRSYTDAEFDELCFEFGVELDDVAEDPATKKTLYYIAVAANRTDLLCIEGLARAFRSFLGHIEPPSYAAVEPPAGQRMVMHVKPSVQGIRPYVVCAVLRGVSFTQARYDSFIDLQDKLHHNIARKRTIVAIGTHDLGTLTPPFSYEALPPREISFVPLTQSRAFRADELMEFYRTDPSVKHIKPYTDIIADRCAAALRGR